MIVVDPWHWLHPDGSLPEAPQRLRARALTVAQCIEYGGPLPVHSGRETLIRCRRRPKGRACSGFLWVVKTQAQEIHAFCPTCGTDEYLIHNWEQTPWAAGPMDALPLDEMTSADIGDEMGSHGFGSGVFTDASGAAPSLDMPTLHQRIATALHMLKAPVQVSTVLEMIDRAEQPSEVISSVMQHADVSDVLLVREFLQILMDAWHLKQQGRRVGSMVDGRAVVGGGALEEVSAHAIAPVFDSFDNHVSLERVCPCGSGKPQVRCCLLN